MSEAKPIWGIDVSHYQAGLNMSTVKREGFSFVVAKASEGTYIQDESYHRHVSAASEAGLITGAYHFLTKEPIDHQLNNFLEAANPKNNFAGRMVMVDVEDPNWPTGLGFGGPDVHDVWNFLAALNKEIGPHPIIVYSGDYWISHLGNPSLRGLAEDLDLHLWDAHYPTVRRGYASVVYHRNVPAQFWDPRWGHVPPVRRPLLQFTDQALVAGGYVDADAFRYDHEHLLYLTSGASKPHRPPILTNLEARIDSALAWAKHFEGRVPYGSGWDPNTWPAGAPLYSRYDPEVHDIQYILDHDCICSGFTNLLRGHLKLQAPGRKEGDHFPGGTAAYERTYAEIPGVERYSAFKHYPRGTLYIAPFQANLLRLQGHVAVELGDNRIAQSRVAAGVDYQRTRQQCSRDMVAAGGADFRYAVPPNIWLGQGS